MKIFILFMCLLGIIYAETRNSKEICNPEKACKSKEPCNPEDFKEICQALKDCANKTNCGNLQCTNVVDIAAWTCAAEEAGAITNNTINEEKFVNQCKVIFTRKEDVCCCEKVVKECLDNGCKDLGCINRDEVTCVIACIIRSGLFENMCCG